MSDIVERLRYGAICPASGDGDGDKLAAASEIESLRQQLAEKDAEIGVLSETKESIWQALKLKEAQLAAAQQKAAEACAKLAACRNANGSMRFTHRDEILDALCNGEWREYL